MTPFPFDKELPKSMLQRVLRTALSMQLVHAHDHLLLGVSGGADSMAMLCALSKLRSQLGIRLSVAHLNHSLRGEEADEDMAFVAGVSADLALPFVGEKIDVAHRVRSSKLSVEMVARKERYAFFSRHARRIGAHSIATAHTSDDQCETILMRLFRGSGSYGLEGIPYRSWQSGVAVVRPLLDVSRSEVCAFLKAQGMAWREDSSNRDTSILRNRVRHKVLPFLEKEMTPQLRNILLRANELVRADEAWISATVEKALGACTEEAKSSQLSAARLCTYALGLRRRIIRAWLHKEGVPPSLVNFDLCSRVNGLLSSECGFKSTPISGGGFVVRQYDVLLIQSNPLAAGLPLCTRLVFPGTQDLPDVGLRVATWASTGIIKTQSPALGALPAETSLNRERVEKTPIVLRFWQKGDRISPLGMKGSKKLQDLFTERKVPRPLRHRIPLLESQGKIVWIPGYRIDRNWAVGEEEDSFCVRIERI